MPVRIIGRGKYIILHTGFGQCFGVSHIILFLRICKMHYCLDFSVPILLHLLDCFTSGAENCCGISILQTALSGDSIVGLIADLYHSDIDACIQQSVQAIHRILFYCCCLLLNGHVCPGFRCLLLAGICPEIGIMEIDQNPHSGFGSQFTHVYSFLQVIIATAVAVTGCIVRVVPYTDTYVVNTAVFQQFEKSCIIQFISCKIIIFYTAVFQSSVG